MCMETEHVSLSEVRQRKVLYDTTSMWNLAKPNIRTESKMVITRAWGLGEWDGYCLRIQICSK